MIKVTGINHIAIAAPAQLAEMRRFYVDVLGIASVPRAIPKELEETIPGFWLDLWRTPRSTSWSARSRRRTARTSRPGSART